jgi:hypothetical protein
MSTKDERERIELLQGTLDLLILRTLLLGARHCHALSKTIEFNSDDALRLSRVRFIQRCTGCSSGDGFRWKRDFGKQSTGQVLPIND